MNKISTKNKSKTSHLKLKDFSPTSFEVKPIIWSDSDNEEINKLKSLFFFKDDFDSRSFSKYGSRYNYSTVRLWPLFGSVTL